MVNVLAIGAHPDDIELGCSATRARAMVVYWAKDFACVGRVGGVSGISGWSEMGGGLRSRKAGDI